MAGNRGERGAVAAARASGRRHRWFAVLGVVVLFAVVAGFWWWLRPPFASEYEEASQHTNVLWFNADSGALSMSVELVTTMPEPDDEYQVAGRMANITHFAYFHDNRTLDTLRETPAVHHDAELRGLVDELGEAYDELFEHFAGWEDDGYSEVAWMTMQCSPEPAQARCSDAMDAVRALSPQPQHEVFRRLIEAAETRDRELFANAKKTMQVEGQALLTTVQKRPTAVDEYVHARM